MTAKAAVVGWPIQHSLSPVLHGHWLKEYGIDGSYEKIAIEPGTFAQRVTELREAGYRGVNVTVPYKEEALALADYNDDAARATGATNLLIFRDRGIEGHNTDAFGLAASLRESIGTLENEKIVLLGAGGAARGAVLAMSMLGASIVQVLNRSPERAERLIQSLINSKANFGAGVICAGLDAFSHFAADAALLVNTTSAGMKSNPPLDIDLSALNPKAAVCDIVYNPLMTPLLKDAEARGHRTIDGLGMLMHQAAPSFQAFFYEEMGGRMPEVTSALRAELTNALNARG